MTKVICAILFRFNSDLLITRRSRGQYNGKWEFPGGKVEKGESDTQCLNRELLEELKINAEIKYKFTEFEYHYPEFSINLVSYICYMKEQEIFLVDHDRYEWISVSDIDKFDFLSADEKILNKLKEKSKSKIHKIFDIN